MSFLVVAKFPCKPGQAQAMGGLFRAALPDTGIANVFAPIIDGG